jgi:hypothetical protein
MPSLTLRVSTVSSSTLTAAVSSLFHLSLQNLQTVNYKRAGDYYQGLFGVGLRIHWLFRLIVVLLWVHSAKVRLLLVVWLFLFV